MICWKSAAAPIDGLAPLGAKPLVMSVRITSILPGRPRFRDEPVLQRIGAVAVRHHLGSGNGSLAREHAVG
jgi:hypothetical protein